MKYVEQINTPYFWSKMNSKHLWTLTAQFYAQYVYSDIRLIYFHGIYFWVSVYRIRNTLTTILCMCTQSKSH